MTDSQAAVLTGPVETGQFIPAVCPVAYDLDAIGYVEHEFFASGTAWAFGANGVLTSDGSWNVSAGQSADYRTRIVVRRPRHASRFSGIVLLEWFNVSGGAEADADWAYLWPEITREGHAHVGMSAQALGVIGGTPLLSAEGAAPNGGLVAADPTRYASLAHPGDEFSYDMFGQVGRALRNHDDDAPLGGLRVTRLIALGESQSSIFLTSYINAIHPLGGVFDGFLVHSRGGRGATLAGEAFTAGDQVPGDQAIRSDTDVPVFMLETETDLCDPLLLYAPARQPNSDTIHTWEVAGTAHADTYLVGAFAEALGCVGINDGPHHFVAQAALHALIDWVSKGTAPPAAAPLELSAPPLEVARDELGNAKGGVRTPDVDVPVATLSGVAPAGSTDFCALFGSTVPFDTGTLARLYGDAAGYTDRYTNALDQAIAAGFLLAADRDELLARARRVRF